jgi:hypothetical protein
MTGAGPAACSSRGLLLPWPAPPVDRSCPSSVAILHRTGPALIRSTRFVKSWRDSVTDCALLSNGANRGATRLWSHCEIERPGLTIHTEVIQEVGQRPSAAMREARRLTVAPALALRAGNVVL